MLRHCFVTATLIFFTPSYLHFSCFHFFMHNYHNADCGAELLFSLNSCLEPATKSIFAEFMMHSFKQSLDYQFDLFSKLAILSICRTN